ncbi:hypothetical protein V8E36_003538 [Tilletia maclaganii]
MSALIFTFLHLPPSIRCVTVALVPHLDPRDAAALRRRLIAAPHSSTPEEREALNFAFIDAALITSERHLRTGVHQALLAVARGSGVEGGMKTKTAHSEILFALHPSGNIGDSIRKFGISDSTTSLLILRVGPSNAQAQDHLDSVLAQIRAILPPPQPPSPDPPSLGAGASPATANGALADDLSSSPGRLDEYLSRITRWKDVETVYKLGRDVDALRSGSTRHGGGGHGRAAEQEQQQQQQRRWLDGVVTSIVAMKLVAA